MAKLMILLVSMAGLAAAGVLDTRWMMNERTRQMNDMTWDRTIDRMNVDPIMRMSSEELMRQKFLLMILDHVHQPITDVELLRVSDTFVLDESRYREGIDEDMMHVIELCRNGRQLGKTDVFNISNKEHMRQMMGLHRLLSRCRDWETFKQNVCCARTHLNGVLFVNALLLAIRERDDTRLLIVPGIHEILPELYLDKDTVNTARNIDMNLLTTTTDRDTIRPNLLDMIGLGGRRNVMDRLDNRGIGMWQKSRLWMPWREMRMQMAMQKTPNQNGIIMSEMDDKIVLPVEKRTNLLTDDVGLKGFLHIMLNDLCLRENELKNMRTMRTGRVSINRNVGMTMMNNNSERDWNNMNTLDTDRLLGRRRNIDTERRAGQWLTSENVKDGRRVMNLDDRRSVNDIDTDNLRRLSTADRMGLRNDDVEQVNTMQDRLMHTMHGSRVHDSRRTMGRTPIDVDERWNHNREMDSLGTTRWQPNWGDLGNQHRFGENTDRTRGMWDLPTTTIDDERLLHVNRRRLSSTEETDRDRTIQQRPRNMRDRFMSILHKPRVHDGRNTVARNNELNMLRTDNNMRWQTDRRRTMMDSDYDDYTDTSRLTWNRNDLDEERDTLGLRNKNTESSMWVGMRPITKMNRRSDDLPTTTIDNDRLLHLNRRRLHEQDDDMTSENIMERHQIRGVSDMRRVKDNSNWSEEMTDVRRKDRMDDERLMGIRKTTVENDRLLHVNRRHLNDENDEIVRDIRHRRTRDTWGMTGNNMENKIQNGLRSDVLLHNIRQILARIEIDRISLGLTKGMIPLKDITSRRMGINRNVNEWRTDRLNMDRDLGNIENTVRRILDTITLPKDVKDPITMDKIIADILMGEEDNINILNIIRDIVANTKTTTHDIQTLQDLGIDIENPIVMTVLKCLNEAIDTHRTNVLGIYTRDDINFNGVTINDITVDHLRTVVDENDIDIRNLIDDRIVNTLSGTHKMIVARQQRMNHKDFTIKIDLDSDHDRRVVVRTMLGPKLIDETGRMMSLDERRDKFMLIDTNIVDLHMGKNIIKRKSRDIMWTTRDTTPLTKIYEHVMMALDTRMNIDNVIPMNNVVGQDCRFPHRLLLPRGRVDGLQMEMLVVVTPLENDVIVRDDITCAMGVGVTKIDRRSLGFPLDRRIENVREWMSLPNLKITDVLIHHDDTVKLTL